MYASARGDVHVNTPLTRISTAYLQTQTEFVAAQVWPHHPDSSRSGAARSGPAPSAARSASEVALPAQAMNTRSFLRI